MKAVAHAAAFLFLLMAVAHRNISTAQKIILLYDGAMPLHHFLRQFFAADKKYGSRDRKAIAHACYCYYRLGKALMDIPVEEKIKAGVFLCSTDLSHWLPALDTSWHSLAEAGVTEKLAWLQQVHPFALQSLFPLHNLLSSEVEPEPFFRSHFTQPYLFLRMRPGKQALVKSKLSKAGIAATPCGNDGLALPNSTDLSNVLRLDVEAVVQDYASQQVADFLRQLPQDRAMKVWDCCTASGGKAMLAHDLLQIKQLVVSDVRESILENLARRFAAAGIRNYASFVADITRQEQLPGEKFDLIICDAPCSGSGTWSRTPEQMTFFTPEKLNHYTHLQKAIAVNAARCLAPQGYLLYITCSVYAPENEAVVAHILENTSLQLVKMHTIKGYDQQADSMFAALFTSG